MISTEDLVKFIEKIKYHKENLYLFQKDGLTPGGHTFISTDEDDKCEINHMRHSDNVVLFESVPFSDMNVFEDAIRFTTDSHVRYSIVRKPSPNEQYHVYHWDFYMCSTEEELFQAGTIHDMKELTLDIIMDLQKLYDDFSEMCDKVPPIN